MKVLLLGGSEEARALAALLTADAAVDVVSSLPGQPSGVGPPLGRVRIGGFGGVRGLVDWLREESVEAVVDATPSFAATMTERAAEATRSVGVPLLVLRRPGWVPGPGDDWHWAGDLASAADLTPTVGSRPFLTVGSHGLDAFAGLGLPTLARCDEPPEPRPRWCELIVDPGPHTVAGERDLFGRHGIDVLVSKDCGGPMTGAKLTAARELAVPVVMIRRPAVPPEVESVESVPDAVSWLRTVV